MEIFIVLNVRVNLVFYLMNENLVDYFILNIDLWT